MQTATSLSPPCQSVLQIDVEVEEPETLENSIRSRLRFIISSGGAHSFGCDNIYYII